MQWLLYANHIQNAYRTINTWVKICNFLYVHDQHCLSGILFKHMSTTTLCTLMCAHRIMAPSIHLYHRRRLKLQYTSRTTNFATQAKYPND